MINRRNLLSLAAAAGATTLLNPSRLIAQDKKPKILFLTKSTGFQHSVIQRKDPNKLAYAEEILVKWGNDNGYDIVASKDASLMNPDKIGQWDAFAFYTTEDLTRPSPKPNGKDRLVDEPPMSAEGKEALLKAIADGKGVIGFHCATDTFHSGKRPKPNEQLLKDQKYEDNRDPFIKMIGGEFAGHGAQMKAKMVVTSKTFPGLEDLADYEMHEEWYNLMNLAGDLHVILAQDTSTMKTDGGNAMYKRPPYPATWARMHDKGRVFYTSMGHREDVWTNPIFQKITLAGLAWITGRTKADVTPNIAKATPEVVTFANAK